MSRHADFILSLLCVSEAASSIAFNFQKLLFIYHNKILQCFGCGQCLFEILSKEPFFFFFSFFKQYETLHEFAWYPCAGSIFFSLQREPGFLRSAFVFLELPSHFVSPVLSVSYVPMESSASAGLNSRDSGQIRCKNKGSRKLECVVNTLRESQQEKHNLHLADSKHFRNTLVP